jgi:hypothetical protein
VEGAALPLLAWDRMDGGVTGWLCDPPGVPHSSLFDLHRLLLSYFGGVRERFGEPAGTWLLNHTDALTARIAKRDASFIRDYSWAFEQTGGAPPIDLTSYYPIAEEANGNCTLVHRQLGDVLLFAPDHAFHHVTPLEGCPEYTLYRLNGAPTFGEWVEIISAQWLSLVR